MLSHVDEDTLFLVYGVGGIGKSELVYRVLQEVLMRPGWQAATSVHLAIRPGATTTRALAELLEAVGAPPRPRRGEPTEVAHLQEQLAVLAAVLEDRPTLVFLDDVHHLPPAAVAEALHYLSRHVRRSRVFVASRREIHLSADTPPPIVTHLGPLDAHSASAMVDALAERMQVPRPADEEVLRATHGSPFHIRRLLARTTPEDDSLEVTLGELGEDARRLLRVIGAAPHRPSLAALRRRFGDDAAFDALVHDLGQRFLLEVERGRARVHDLVGEPLARHASEAERAAAREACAALCVDELERGEAPSRMLAVDAAQLYLEAGRPEEAWAVIEGWHSALAAAGQDHLLREPLARLREALPERRVAIDLLRARTLVRASLIDEADRLLGQIGEPRSAAEDVRWHALAGEVAQRRGALGDAEALFEQAVARAPDARTRLQARLQTAVVALYRGEGERARAIVDEAEAGAEGLRATERARCDWVRALSWLYDERFDRGLADARRAREALEGTGSADLVSRFAMVETLAAIESEDMKRAREAAAAIGETPLRERVASLYRVVLRYAAGGAAGSVEELLEAHDAFRAQGDTINAYVAGHYGAGALAEVGRLGEAQALAERNAELVRRAGIGTFVARSLAQQAIFAAEAVLAPMAHRLADEALAIPEIGPLSRATAHRAHAHASTIEGEFAEALAHLARARESVAGLHAAQIAIEVEHAAVELVGGSLDAAVARAERAARSYRDRRRDYDAARTLMVLAASYIARGGKADLLQADEALAQARRLAEGAGYRAVQVGCAVVEAALARRRGEDAQALLERALRELDPERGSLYARTLLAAIEGGAGAKAAPGAVALLAHLGFSAAVDGYLVDRSGRRAATEDDVARERERRELFVDARNAIIVARGGEPIRGRPMQAALLATLIRGRGEPVSAETLYTQVWGAAEYHPLRNRNALYVALNRLRKSLKEPFGEREIVERHGGGWRVAEDVDACAVLPVREAGDRA